MVRIPLHMVSLCGLLLVLSGSRGGPARCRCRDETQADKHWKRLLKQYREDVRLAGTSRCHESAQSRSRTCDQVIKEMIKDPWTHQDNQRSASPWEYLLDQNEERFPPQISVARCLCEGCIIHRQENRNYNSVPVCAQMMVLWKKTCSHDPKKYVITKEFISVPVACTCVRPKY
ncbi:interleukin-17C-like [Kryptolebias marmoratus]|uniref:interleukin-17C-like n=1 Tax=Kryptolebias marmoratus TaxID=37003 RepID=UPI0007F92B8A|nr:interleukin-17C-like [Kryptolebias marmoratus]